MGDGMVTVMMMVQTTSIQKVIAEISSLNTRIEQTFE